MSELVSDLFVAVDGDDSWSGRLRQPNGSGTDGPFASLERARDQIRQLKLAGELDTRGVTVWVGGGTYERFDSFCLTEADSGAAGAPICYRSYEGESVRLIGGVSLKREWFSSVEDQEILDRIIDEGAKEKLVCVDLKAHGITDYGVLSKAGFLQKSQTASMELYVNGSRMPLARWPNLGDEFLHLESVIDPGPDYGDADYERSGGTFSYDSERPLLWEQADEIWLDGVFSKDWAWNRNRVERIDTVNKEITLSYGTPYGLLDWKCDFFFAENLLEEIDLPGEYYLDRNSGVLYLLPPEDFYNEDVSISVSLLKSAMVAMNQASYVVFRGFVFATGRGDAVSINGGEGVEIDACEVRDFAESGVVIHGCNHAVVNCHIHDLGATGVSLSGGDFDSLTPGNNRVENCKIHDIAYRNKVYCPGVNLHGVGHKVVHSLFYDIPHMGINVGGE